MTLVAVARAGEPVPEGWRRESFQPGGGKAELHYVVFGRFAPQAKLKLERENYCKALLSLPAGAPETVRLAQAAPTCASLVVEAPDPSSLVYLRDAIRSLSALAGVVAIYDIPSATWRSAAEWRKTFAEPLPFRLQDHIDLVIRPERDLKGIWIRTRGMHKFGRPEVTMHHAPTDDQAWAELVFQIAGSMADGMSYPAEATVRPSGSAIKSFVIRRQHDPEFEDERLFISKE
jgi:hypothetical protein